MPSQKRYRQHQENNNSSRFRDIPPRFKRQKSSSAGEEPSSPETTSSETQKSIARNHSPDTKKTTDPQELVKSQALMAPNYSNLYAPEENLPQQVGARAHIVQTPQGVTSAWQWPQKLNGALILSQWDSRHLDKVTNIQSCHVPLGTHFGYKSDSPPLSPWASTNASNFSGQHGATSSPTWNSSSTDACSTQRAHNSSPAYFNNENWAPTEKVKFHSSPPALWSASSPPPLQRNNSASSLQSHISLSKSNEKATRSKEMQTGAKQMIDYSDPDIRTIEMLRELERVADEKESECDNFGADRKSLVSHHLRMLMCAVDRYTEGIDDDLSMATRGDEVTTNDSYLSSPRGSPVPNETWTQKQAKEIPRSATPDLGTPLWSPSLQRSAWKGPAAAEPASSASAHLTVPTQSHEALFSSPQASPVWKQHKIIKCPETAAWDLWSSPSFDFSGVLINQSAEDITRDPFGRFTDKNERERKPLYQR